MRYRKLTGEAAEFLSFPVLVAISRGPHTTAELSRKLLVSRANVYNHLKRLEQLGYVVRRKVDNRWVLVVRVRMEGVPQTARGQVMPGQATEEVALDALPTATKQEPAGATQRAEAVSVAVQPSPVQAAGQGLSAAGALAARFGVPEAGLDGELAIGPIGQCKTCGRPTVLKYGDVRTCVACARAAAPVKSAN